MDGQGSAKKISIVLTDVGICHDVYIHRGSTLKDYFNLIDPEMKYWHSIGMLLLDDFDLNTTFGELGLKGKDTTIWADLRTDHPWWTAEEITYPETTQDKEVHRNTWKAIYGVWSLDN